MFSAFVATFIASLFLNFRHDRRTPIPQSSSSSSKLSPNTKVIRIPVSHHCTDKEPSLVLLHRSTAQYSSSLQLHLHPTIQLQDLKFWKSGRYIHQSIIHFDHLLTYPPTHTRSPCLSIKAAHALCLSPELVVALHSHIHTCSTYVHIHDFSSHGIIQHWPLYDLATHSILTSRGYQ